MPADLNQRAKAIVDLATGPHQTLVRQTTPARAAGVASYPWSLTQVAGLLDGKVPSN